MLAASSIHRSASIFRHFLGLHIPLRSAHPSLLRTEYKVVPLPTFLPPGTLKKDVMRTPPSELAEEKSAAEAAILQQALDQYGKEGWELVTISVHGMLIFKR
jgi:hypothetical protein